jgi:chromosome segregation ATPase
MSAKPEALEFEVPADDFQALEEKVYRTIELLKSAREGKAAAERDGLRLREQLDAREVEVETLKRELLKLRKDREEVRSRVERMMRQIEDVAAAS